MKKVLSTLMFAFPVHFLLLGTLSCLLIQTGCTGTSTKGLSLFDNYYHPYADAFTESGEGLDNDTTRQALVFYRNGEYKDASRAFEKLLETDAYNDTLRFYCGLSYLGMKDGENAYHHLIKALDTQGSVYSSPATWYLGLTYLEAEEGRDTAQTLQPLTRSGNPYQRPAMGLLAKLPKASQGAEPAPWEEPAPSPPPTASPSRLHEVPLPEGWEFSQNSLATFRRCMGNEIPGDWLMEKMAQGALIAENPDSRSFVLIFPYQGKDLLDMDENIQSGEIGGNGTFLQLFSTIDLVSPDQLSYTYRGQIGSKESIVHGISKLTSEGALAIWAIGSASENLGTLIEEAELIVQYLPASDPDGEDWYMMARKD